MAWKRRSRPCLAVPPADSPSTRNNSQRSGSFSWQSASLPGSPPEWSAPLRLVRSRALRAASRPRAASLGRPTLLPLAVGQLAGQSTGIERTFAPGQVARLAGRLARAGRVNSLPHDLAHHRRILVEILARLVVDELGHVSGDIAVQLALGLAFELRLRDLHADHGRQAFAHIVAGQVLFDIFEQPGLLPGCVDGAGESAAEAA